MGPKGNGGDLYRGPRGGDVLPMVAKGGFGREFVAKVSRKCWTIFGGVPGRNLSNENFGNEPGNEFGIVPSKDLAMSPPWILT